MSYVCALETPSDPVDLRQIVVGRQPITNRAGVVIGFELLYRSRHAGAPRPSAEQMTARVVLGALSIGVDRLVGNGQMFCNAERSVLLGEAPITLPPDRTVIEVLETVEIDDEVVEGCRRLVAEGFTLALDDFVWIDGAERLLELATIVKVDLLALSRDEIVDLVTRCRKYDVKLLAEKVETAEDVTWAMEAGFDLFQGYAIERPALVRGGTLAASVTAHLQLAATLLADEIDLEELEQILRREPGLVVQLLQLASAGAHFGLRGNVRTVREALVLLGSVRVRQWLALTVLGEQGEKSPNALATALIRGRMCELLATSRGVENAEVAFTAGLLSALDLLMGIDSAELESALEIDEALLSAAFRRTGRLGELVGEVADYQDDLRIGSDDVVEDLDAAAAEAFTWAMPLVTGLEQAPRAV